MTNTAMRRRAVLITGLAALLLAVPVLTNAAEPAPTPSTTDVELAEQVQALQQRLLELETARDLQIEEIKQQLAALEEALLELQAQREQEELAAIRSEAERITAEERDQERAAEVQRETFVGRERTLQAMNPEISFLGDVSYEWSDSPDIQDRFVLRGAELALQAPLDPYTRFKAFLAAHQEPPLLEHEGEAKQEEEAEPAHEHAEEISVSLEEAYLEWVALPLGTRLRVGKFRQQLGTLNRWHPHALQTVDLPFALRNLFGHDGLIGLGVGADWQLPRLWATANGLTVEIVNADNPLAFAGSEFDDPSFLLRHTGFFDLGPNTYFELGLTGMVGPNGVSDSSDTTLGSIDLNLLWEPVQEAKYRGLEIRGELIHARYETDGDAVSSDSFYLYLTWKLGRRWSIGFRYDDAELPYPDVELNHEQQFVEGLGERAVSPYLTFWQSEFVRLRLEYQHAWRDFTWEWGPDTDNRVLLQATFAAGPHKHEEY